MHFEEGKEVHPSMATIALDIHGQELRSSLINTKFSKLTDVIVRHLARFRRIALRFLGNIADAEDAVQDAFLAAFTHQDQFRGQAKMSTWHGHRDQCRSHQVASTFTASANFSRRNPRRARPSASRDAARPPTKPRRGMLQAGNCPQSRRRDNPTFPYLARTMSTSLLAPVCA